MSSESSFSDTKIVFVKIETAFSPSDAQDAGRIIRDSLQRVWKCNVDVIVTREDISFMNLQDLVKILESKKK